MPLIPGKIGSKPIPGGIIEIPEQPYPSGNGQFIMDTNGNFLMDDDGNFRVHDPNADPCCLQIYEGCCEPNRIPTAYLCTLSNVRLCQCCGWTLPTMGHEWYWRRENALNLPTYVGLATQIYGADVCIWNSELSMDADGWENDSGFDEFRTCAEHWFNTYDHYEFLNIYINRRTENPPYPAGMYIGFNFTSLPGGFRYGTTTTISNMYAGPNCNESYTVTAPVWQCIHTNHDLVRNVTGGTLTISPIYE